MATVDQERRRRRPLPGLVVRVCIMVAAFVVLLFVPSITDDYLTGLFVNMAIFGTVTMSWNLVFGYAGVFSLGQMAFFAVGGYAAGLANVHWGLSPWLCLLFGGLVAGVAGLAMGIPSLRLYGPYMVLFTLAFQIVLAGLINTVWTDTTGGSAGLFGISLLEFGDLEPLTVGFYAGLAMVAVTFVVIALLLRSPIGQGIEVLKEGHTQAEARGISLFHHRVIVFSVSAALTGVAGAFYAHYFGIITPAILGIGLLINLLAWMVIGGLGTQLGPLLGAGIGVYLNDTLSQTQEYSQLIWGLVLVAVVAVAPGGIVRTGAAIGRWLVALALWALRRRPEPPPRPALPALGLNLRRSNDGVRASGDTWLRRRSRDQT